MLIRATDVLTMSTKFIENAAVGIDNDTACLASTQLTVAQRLPTDVVAHLFDFCTTNELHPVYAEVCKIKTRGYQLFALPIFWEQSEWSHAEEEDDPCTAMVSIYWHILCEHHLPKVAHLKRSLVKHIHVVKRCDPRQRRRQPSL